VPATETPPNLVRITGSTFSLRVLAAAIILLFCYYAQGVVITLLLSILLAYFLDPAVEFSSPSWSPAGTDSANAPRISPRTGRNTAAC
jgi:hypothetical protein